MNVGSVFLDKVLMSQAVSDDKAVQTKQAAPGSAFNEQALEGDPLLSTS